MNSDSSQVMRVLVVDDTVENRRLYGVILRDLGAEVYEADSGEAALTRCAGQEYAMILLDVHLPGLTGFETARRIRELACCAYTPIIFVSAVYTRDADAFAGYGMGAVDYLIAPVVPEILRAKTRVFIDLLRTRRELEIANSELRAANAGLESFSYTAAHDLKAPLHHISGYAGVLVKRCAGLDEVSKGHLARIVEEAGRGAQLIDDMLALANISRKGLVRSPVDLSAGAQAIADELMQTAPRRQVTWQIAPNLTAQGDAGMLRILLANLLGNAFKFTTQQAAARIEFGQRQVAGGVMYFVADNGAGFDLKEAGEKLFRPFQRFHRADEFPGTGVGLATVERVVQRHGGRVWIESAPGQGTTVSFTLG